MQARAAELDLVGLGVLATVSGLGGRIFATPCSSRGPRIPALLLNTITAVGGGTVHELILRRTPGIITGPRYATSAVVAGGV